MNCERSGNARAILVTEGPLLAATDLKKDFLCYTKLYRRLVELYREWHLIG
jgi:hypothetical protein